MKRLICTLGCLALLTAPAAMAGGGSTLSGYGGNGGTVQGTVQKTGGLPFTGLNLAVVFAIGIVLIALGAAMRRTARSGI